MPVGVKVGPVIAMSRQRSGGGCLGNLFLGIVVVGAVVFVAGWPFLIKGLATGWAVAIEVAYVAVVLATIATVADYRQRHRRRTTYFGKLESIGWRCHHGHATLDEAKACAAAYQQTDEYRAAKAGSIAVVTTESHLPDPAYRRMDGLS